MRSALRRLASRVLSSALFVTLGVAATAACGVGPSDLGLEEDDTDADEAPLVSTGSMPDADAKDIRHISQGADWVPLAVVRALVVDNPKKGDPLEPETVPFLDPRVQRPLRMLRDEDRLAGDLPLGVTVGAQADLGYVGIGLGCSACHVAEWQYSTASGLRTMRVYGAPNTFDGAAWFDSLFKALAKNAVSPAFWDRVRTESDKIATEYPALANKARSKAPNVTSFDVTKDLVLWMLDMKSDADITVRWGDDFMRLMRSRGYFFKGVKRRGSIKGTPTGPGRLDMPTAIKAYVFAESGWTPPTTVASANNGSWYFVARSDWFQINANVNTSLLRDIAETSTGGGAVDMFGPNPSYRSTIDFDATARIDQIVAHAIPPVWPTDAPARDEAAAKRGEAIYKATCRGCHEPRVTERGLLHFTNLACRTVGVDCDYAKSYLEPVGGVPAAGRLTEVFSRTRDAYFASRGIDRATGLAMEDVYDAELNPRGRREPGKFQFTDGYRANPLDGMWATAPFLHNGSVPTIADLLKPASERPRKFWLGHRRYDMQDLGLVSISESQGPRADLQADFLFDTSLPGNSNGGHEYGVRLPPEDKRALLEFLKGLGGGRSEPTIYAEPLPTLTEATVGE